MTEMALPPQGGAKHLATKPIAGQDVNLDSDQEIMARTQKANGKWSYYSSTGKLLAEAAAPSSVTAGIVSQWCQAVRARTKRELTQEDVDRKIKMREEKSNGLVGPDGRPIGESTADSVPSVPAEKVREAEVEQSDDVSTDDYLKRRLDAVKTLEASHVKQVHEAEAALLSAENALEAARAERKKVEKLIKLMEEE